MLYVVPTPIGNLGDLSYRAVEVLQTADFIIAENPVFSHKLLQHYHIPKKEVLQFADHNELKRLPALLAKLADADAALITDAGTPGVSDPGYRLVKACADAAIEVVALPGPSAAITALSASGLPTDKFLFIGFLGKTEHKVVEALGQAEKVGATAIFYESPERIMKTLGFIAQHFPEAQIAVARELTKLHETIERGTPAEVIPKVKAKGEFTVCISFKSL